MNTEETKLKPMHIMDKRIMDLFDYNSCLMAVDALLLEFERVSYKMIEFNSRNIEDIKLSKYGYNNRVLSNVIKRIENEEDYQYIYCKLKSIYETFCSIEKDYFNNCMLHRKITDEQFSEVNNISIMNMRKIKKSVVFKITEGFNISIMKGEL